MDGVELLRAYDEQLRGGPEVGNAVRVEQVGPIWRSVQRWGGGFVTYHDLAGLAGDDLEGLIADTVRWFRDETDVDRAEWKTRGHDAPGDLGERLRAHGFEPEPAETVMIGAVADLVREVALPPGVEVVRVEVADPRAEELLVGLSRMQSEVFGDDRGQDVEEALADIARGDAVYCVAVADGVVVSGGNIRPVPGTEFAGIWGGATRPEWRGRGIYAAVTSARAQAVMGRGVRLVHSDCTEMSRPILERAGLERVTTTTPYLWHR